MLQIQYLAGLGTDMAEERLMDYSKRIPPLADLINLKGKRALITGGASGIGYASAGRLAEAGAAVAILDLDTVKGPAAVQNIRQAGYTAFFMACDLASEEDINRALPAAVQSLDGLDILVNNAGIFPLTPLADITATDIDHVLAINLKGLLLLTRLAVQTMINQKRGGVIVNLASVDALHPIRNQMVVYDASKGAVLSLTRSLAKELAADGIRVNAVAPGGILTEGAASDRTGGTRATLRETMSRIPLGHMGSADEVARVILFLASDLSAYMTGALIAVDGGFMVG
jgi:2-dehydro-3-deoxy-D-gluconate 5-dehydrogenase